MDIYIHNIHRLFLTWETHESTSPILSIVLISIHNLSFLHKSLTPSLAQNCWEATLWLTETKLTDFIKSLFNPVQKGDQQG